MNHLHQDDPSQSEGSNVYPLSPRQSEDGIVWLHVTHSQRFQASEVDGWRRRLQAYLSSRGLLAAVSLEHIALLPLRGPITSTDRGALLGWLAAQPEVVLIRIERRRREPDSHESA